VGAAHKSQHERTRVRITTSFNTALARGRGPRVSRSPQRGAETPIELKEKTMTQGIKQKTRTRDCIQRGKSKAKRHQRRADRRQIKREIRQKITENHTEIE